MFSQVCVISSVHLGGGGASWSGVCAPGPRHTNLDTHPPTTPPTGTRQTGGTHPIGMLSYFGKMSYNIAKIEA